MRFSVDITLDDLAEAICQMDQAEIVELLMKIDEIMADSAFTAEVAEHFRLIVEQDRRDSAKTEAAMWELKAVQRMGYDVV